MRIIETSAAPAPGGHYSQAIVHGGLVYVSGILPIGPNGRIDAGQTFPDQVRRVLRNARAILAAAGSGPDRLLKTTAYITDVEDWGMFDRHYAAWTGAHRPARSVVPVPMLHHGFRIEIDLIAVVGGSNADDDEKTA